MNDDHALPAPFHDWVQQAVGEPVVGEPAVQCQPCLMCATPTSHPGTPVVFRPDTKCCAMAPVLPNFLVGRALQDPDAAGSVRARIAAGAGVSPLGLSVPPIVAALERLGMEALGQSDQVRCPHFVAQTGSCGIWKHRNHRCATYFCRHERGLVGARFWGALATMLKLAEQAVAWHGAMAVIDDPARLAAMLTQAPETLDAAALDGRAGAREQAAWGPQGADKEAFFVAVSQHVDGLSWADVEQIGGPELAVAAAAVRYAHHAATSKPSAQRLRTGPHRLVGVSPTGTSVITHSGTDPIVLPAELLAVLHVFDGSTTTEIAATLAADYGMALHEDLLGRLLDWGVLVDTTGHR
jgi:hypothetical protein